MSIAVVWQSIPSASSSPRTTITSVSCSASNTFTNLWFGFGTGSVATRPPSSFVHRRHDALLAFVRLQAFLAQSQRLRRYFNKFVIGNEFDRLLKVQLSKRHQPYGFV